MPKSGAGFTGRLTSYRLNDRRTFQPPRLLMILRSGFSRSLSMKPSDMHDW